MNISFIHYSLSNFFHILNNKKFYFYLILIKLQVLPKISLITRSSTLIIIEIKLPI